MRTKTIGTMAAVALLAGGCATIIPVPDEFHEDTSCPSLEYQIKHFDRGHKRIAAHFRERAKVMTNEPKGMEDAQHRQYEEHRTTLKRVYARHCG